MATVHVWTKQHQRMLDDLLRDGRYITPKAYIMRQHEDGADVFLTVYDWFTATASRLKPKPADVSYPIWLSLSRESAMLNGEGEVTLELALDEDLILPVDIAKWSTILNYSYIPEDDADLRRHQQLLRDHGVAGDAKALMTPFYPLIKREIIASWERLFDASMMADNTVSVGTIWEVKKEWLVEVIR